VVEPLGYRRVLSDEESAGWRCALEQPGAHHPLLTDDVPENVLVVHASAMWDGPGIRLVREALASRDRDPGAR